MIKGILFDKDGTLVDFFSLWLQAAKAVVPEFLYENQIEATEEMKEYVLKAMGVENGKVDPRGALAYKSYQEIAKDLCNALLEKGFRLHPVKAQKQLEHLFDETVAGGQVSYKQLTDIKAVMRILREKGISIGLATADTMRSARNCLEALGTYQQFDYVGADDGVKRPKPEADMFLEFQRKFQLKPEEIAVVGDTYNDMVFAKNNGGIAIGVLSGVSQEADLCEKADYILHSVQELPELLEKLQA